MRVSKGASYAAQMNTGDRKRGDGPGAQSTWRTRNMEQALLLTLSVLVFALMIYLRRG